MTYKMPASQFSNLPKKKKRKEEESVIRFLIIRNVDPAITVFFHCHAFIFSPSHPSHLPLLLPSLPTIYLQSSSHLQHPLLPSSFTVLFLFLTFQFLLSKSKAKYRDRKFKRKTNSKRFAAIFSSKQYNIQECLNITRKKAKRLFM